MSRPKVSIILPIYNQEDHLVKVVTGHLSELKRLSADIEMILVVNGCTDGSLAAAKGLAEKEELVRVLSSDRTGWGNAVREGLAEAQGDLICYANSARTTPRDLTLLLIYALAYPETVVKANRKVRENWRRRLGSLLFNLECRMLFDLHYWDINGTPKVFPRSFKKLMALSRKDDLIDLEFNRICRTEDYPVVEVPIFSTRRFGGKSTTNYLSAIKMYSGAIAMWLESGDNKVRDAD